MKLTPPPRSVAHAGLRALKTICLTAKKDLSDLQTQFILGVQKHILDTNFSLESLDPISPLELATIVTDGELKDRIIRACIITGCIDGSMDGVEVQKIEEFAKALNVDMNPINTAWKLANRHLILARADIVRKSLPGVKVKQIAQKDGVFAVLKQFLPMLGMEMTEVTARYRKLKDYPMGTLGKEFIHYINKNKFPLPGEKGAGPEIIVTHDCLHILGDYGTSATEEIEVAAFQAGCQTGDPLYGLLFGLAQYHLGIQVAPVAPPEQLQANPEKMIAAFARGCRMKRDMWTDFNPWDHFTKQVDALRDDLGVIPK